MIHTAIKAEYIYRLDGNVPGSWEKSVILKGEEIAGVKPFTDLKGTLKRLEMGWILFSLRQEGRKSQRGQTQGQGDTTLLTSVRMNTLARSTDEN